MTTPLSEWGHFPGMRLVEIPGINGGTVFVDPYKVENILCDPPSPETSIVIDMANGRRVICKQGVTKEEIVNILFPPRDKEAVK